jgi:MoaA/NifB/PqqE/SkfB family radical SAM enzyme
MTGQTDSFCPAPWVTFYLEPNGRVDMCCISSSQLGTVHEHSLKEILKSHQLIEIKQMMRENRPVSACKSCHQVPVLQERFIKGFGGRHHPDYQDIEGFKLKYLDLRWNNTCNYACIYCGPELSSLWAQIKDSKQTKISHVKQDMIDLMIENIDSLEEVYLAGGEPLMLKENVTVLAALLDRNPKCKIWCNTNLSTIEDNQIFDLLCQFDHVHWHVSGEAIGSQYEYIRWPGQWKVFDANLRKLKSIDKPNHKMAFNLVWLNLNGIEIWNYIDHLVSLDIDIGLVSILPYNMNNWPGPWHLKNMPRDFLETVRARMMHPVYQQIHTYQQNLEFITKQLNDVDHMPDMLSIASTLAEMDRTRNLDSRSVFPHIHSYLQS